MAFESIRAYLQLASGLVEVTRAKATEAAMSLLTLPSTLSGGTLSTQAQDLAEELMAAAAANRSNLLALIRNEVEKAVAKASVMSLDELDRARAGMAKLSSDVEELRDEVLAMPAVRAVPGATEMSTMLGLRAGMPRTSRPTAATIGGAVVSGPAPLEEIVRPVAPVPAQRTTTKKAASTKRAVAKKGAAVSRPVSESAVTSSPASATKAVTKKAATKKAATKKATAAPASTTKKAATKKAATKKATAAPASTTKKAATKKATAAPASTTKKAATRQTATKRTPTKKATATGAAR